MQLESSIVYYTLRSYQFGMMPAIALVNCTVMKVNPLRDCQRDNWSIDIAT